MLMDGKPEIKSEDSETAEINELARQIKASHDKLRTSSVAMQSTDVATQITPSKTVGKDTLSSLVKFGWETIPNTPAFPFVRRGSQCFVANQICRKLIFSDVYKKFSLHTTDCLPVDMVNMTQSEADVFNEINIIHCDKSLVGDHCFQEGQAMTDLQEVKASFKFFEACEKTMISKKFENDLFGFIKIAHENEVPFVWSECKKLVPLFYFEGQSEYLDSRSINLTDKWKLGYLKFCCLVQNIRKDLYNGSLLKVVDIEDVKKLFPENTSFELCWPEECNQELLAPEVRFAALFGVQESSIPTAHCQQVPDSYVASQKNVSSPGVPARHSPLNQELLAPKVDFAASYGAREVSIPTAGLSQVSHFQKVPGSDAAFQKNLASSGVPVRYSPSNFHQSHTANNSTVPYPCYTTNNSSEKMGNVRLAKDNTAKVNSTCRKRSTTTDKLTPVTGKVKRRNLKDSPQNSLAPVVENIPDGLLGTFASRNSNTLLNNRQNMVMTPMSPSVYRTRTTNVPYRSPQTASSPELRLHSPLMSEAATSRQFTHDNLHTNYTTISNHPETTPIWQYSRTVQPGEVQQQKMAITQSFPTSVTPSYLRSITQRPPPVVSSQTTAGVSTCSTPVLSSSSTQSTSQNSVIDSQSCSSLLDELFSLLIPPPNAKMPQNCSSGYSQSVLRNPNTFPRTNSHEISSISSNNFSPEMCHQLPTSAFQRSIINNREINQIPQSSFASIKSLLGSKVPYTRPQATPYGTATTLSESFPSATYTQSALGCPQKPTNNTKTNQTTAIDVVALRNKISEFFIKNIKFVNLIETENGIKDLMWSFMLEQQMTSVKQQKELGPLIKSIMYHLFKLSKQNSSISVNGIHQQKAPTFGANSYELSSQTIQNFNVTNVIQMNNN